MFYWLPELTNRITAARWPMCIPCDIVTGVAQPFSKSSWNWRIFLFQVGPEVFSSWPDVFELHTSVYIHIQSYSVWLSRTDAIDIWTSVGMASLSALCFVLRIRNPPKAKLWGTKSSMAWHGGSSVDLCTTVIHSDPQCSKLGMFLGLVWLSTERSCLYLGQKLIAC